LLINVEMFLQTVCELCTEKIFSHFMQIRNSVSFALHSLPNSY